MIVLCVSAKRLLARPRGSAYYIQNAAEDQQHHASKTSNTCKYIKSFAYLYMCTYRSVFEHMF